LIFVGVREDLGIAPSHPGPKAKPVTVREALEGVEHEAVPELDEKQERVFSQVTWGGNQTEVYGPGYGFSNRKVHPNKPAPTLTKMQSLSGFGSMVHYSENRVLTVPEGKRLQSFPDQFDLGDGPYSERWAGIGNSVPPLMMKHVAKHVMDEVLED
jgi:DNA (cytosine-5)-methyltransferase 1